ncbi:transposase [Lactobacillus intestinalis]|uniref:transposase n=1 Tax=Lactobacillus intestinalis TaxID=151781 RepID=UPI00350E529F
MYRRRKFDVEPVFGHMKRNFGIRRTHLRGQWAVENDMGLALMALNLTKFSQSISRLETNFINNLKSELRFLIGAKIVVRILLFENQKLIVNSRPRKLLFQN